MLQLKLPDGTVKVLVEGAQRAKVLKYTDRSEYYEAEAVAKRNSLIKLSAVGRQVKHSIHAMQSRSRCARCMRWRIGP
jgi:ATP-dependent Lon protease